MSIEKSAFEFVQLVDGANSLSQLERLFMKHAEPMGVDFFMFAQIVYPHGIINPTRLIGSHDCDWFKFYDQYNLFIDDPAAKFARMTLQPFTWSWLEKSLDLNKSEFIVMNESRNFGLSEGAVFPLHGVLGSLAGASVAGLHFLPNRVELAALNMMVINAYNRAVDIKKIFESENDIALTKRQRECLNWVQLGKSNDDIAAILGISSNTVKDHIEAAKRTFGVGTRIEAVVQARRAKLISY